MEQASSGNEVAVKAQMSKARTESFGCSALTSQKQSKKWRGQGPRMSAYPSPCQGCIMWLSRKLYTLKRDGKQSSSCRRWLETLEVFPQALSQALRAFAHGFDFDQIRTMGLQIGHDAMERPSEGIFTQAGHRQLKHPGSAGPGCRVSGTKGTQVHLQLRLDVHGFKALQVVSNVFGKGEGPKLLNH